jgi:High potential iron-sulfur protein
LALTGGTLSLIGACHKDKVLLCSDTAHLSDAENSLRESLHYTEQSGRVEQMCRGCAYFAGSGANGCGTCNLMKGPVNPLGHCDSWSAAHK